MVNLSDFIETYHEITRYQHKEININKFSECTQEFILAGLLQTWSPPNLKVLSWDWEIENLINWADFVFGILKKGLGNV